MNTTPWPYCFDDCFPPPFVVALAPCRTWLAAQGIDAYLVGGIVRDALLAEGKLTAMPDADITIVGDAIAVAKAFVQVHPEFKIGETFRPFGTAKVIAPGGIDIDFASTREERYAISGALPEVTALGVPLATDLKRRDFTINALALSLGTQPEIHDATGGMADLKNRHLRVLHPASFVEDPSRILRALRFCTRLDFHLADDTQALLDQFLANLPPEYRGGGERIRRELGKLFVLPENAVKTKWIETFFAHGIYRLIDTTLPKAWMFPVPAAEVSSRLAALSQTLQPFWKSSISESIWLAVTLSPFEADSRHAACFRLGLTRTEMETIEATAKLLQNNPVAPLSGDMDPAILDDTLAPLPFAAACIGALMAPKFESAMAALARYKQDLEPQRLDVTGEEVLALGVPPGEAVGQALKMLRHAMLRGQSKIEALDWLKQQLATLPSKGF